MLAEYPSSSYYFLSGFDLHTVYKTLCLLFETLSGVSEQFDKNRFKISLSSNLESYSFLRHQAINRAIDYDPFLA